MGCAKTLEDVAMTPSPEDELRSYLRLIAEGVPTLETPARELAARYGLRQGLVDAAVKDGYRELYESYVQLGDVLSTGRGCWASVSVLTRTSWTRPFGAGYE
jgi:hypothetical protein